MDLNLLAPFSKFLSKSVSPAKATCLKMPCFHEKARFSGAAALHLQYCSILSAGSLRSQSWSTL